MLRRLFFVATFLLLQIPFIQNCVALSPQAMMSVHTAQMVTVSTPVAPMAPKNDQDNEIRRKAIEAYQAGDFETATPLFEILSAHGDSKATVTLAKMYQTGEGKPLDYRKAFDMYLTVWQVNGDAANNLAVMFRDGQGIEANRTIATLMFYTIYLIGMGSDDTQIRAGRNLSRELERMTSAERQQAGCYNAAYMVAYIESKGTLKGVPEGLRGTTNTRFRDVDEEGFLTKDVNGNLDTVVPCPADT